MLTLSAACAPTDPIASAWRDDVAAWRAGDFWAIPWPDDRRLDAAGRPSLAKLPGRSTAPIVDRTLAAFEAGLRGFSPAGAVYFPSSSPLGIELPSGPIATTGSTAPWGIVQLAPGTARFGERAPLEVSAVPSGALLPGGALALLPMPGYTLDPGQRHFAWVRGGAEKPAAGGRRLPPALAADLAAAGVESDGIAIWALFTTADPLQTHRALAARVLSDPPPRFGTPATSDRPVPCDPGDTADVRLVTISLALPHFLSGMAPWRQIGDGRITIDERGRAVPQRNETVTAVLAMPAAGPSPVTAPPLALYLHGAGGDRYSFVRDGTACAMAARGVASLAIDFPIHGLRNPTAIDPYILLVSPENPSAAVAIEQQAMADMLGVARAVTGLQLPAGLIGPHPDLEFTAARIGFIGHSQGSFAGVAVAAFAPEVVAALFSGSGGHMASFVTERLAGSSIDLELYLGIRDGAALQEGLASLLGFPGERLDRFHPISMLVQTLLDPIDPIHAAARVLRHAERPRHVLQVSGMLDRFDPPGVSEPLAVALGLDLAEPAPHPYTRLQASGGRRVTLPAGLQRETAAGLRSAYVSAWAEGDHWVWLNDPAARRQGSDWLADALRDDVPVLRPRCAWDGGRFLCP